MLDVMRVDKTRVVTTGKRTALVPGNQGTFDGRWHRSGLATDTQEAIATIADGVHKGVSGTTKMEDLEQTAIQTAFGQAQARSDALQAGAEEIPEIDTEAFFAKLADDADVEISESGLHYKGTLIDGTQFDSSYDRGAPATFRLNQVVAGFAEGLTKIGVGGKIILYMPSELGYRCTAPRASLLQGIGLGALRDDGAAAVWSSEARYRRLSCSKARGSQDSIHQIRPICFQPANKLPLPPVTWQLAPCLPHAQRVDRSWLGFANSPSFPIMNNLGSSRTRIANRSFFSISK